MSNLYHDLAAVYEAMYQTFIDYEAEFDFYSNILHRYEKRSVLEIGSGTGNLAQYFCENDFAYSGLDYSKEMVALAEAKKMPASFTVGDMRAFQLNEQFESVLLAGRTISYLLQNEEVMKTFSNSFKHLLPKGLLCFDFIDASQFIPTILNGKTIEHEAHFEGTHYRRKSDWKIELDTGMGLDWRSTYFKKAGKEWVEIGTDHSSIRTFTLHEIEIFLSLNHFKILEVIARPSYAFPTYVIVAQRQDR